MILENVNRWLTFVANVAVVGGLVLVAFQIQQNTQTTRAQIVNDYYLADMNLELAMMGENPAEVWVIAIYTPEALTPADAAVLDRYFNYGLVQLQRLERMRELGFADSRWDDRIAYLRWHLGNEVGRRWWARVRDDYSAEFAARVDKVIDVDRNRLLLEALMHKELLPIR